MCEQVVFRKVGDADPLAGQEGALGEIPELLKVAPRWNQASLSQNT